MLLAFGIAQWLMLVLFDPYFKTKDRIYKGFFFFFGVLVKNSLNLILFPQILLRFGKMKILNFKKIE